MADDEPWPVNNAGVPYSLLAQIDCAELPALDGEWPASTAWQHREMLIRIFADCAYVDGTDVVVLEAARGTQLHRRERPPLPTPWPFELPPQDFGLGENAQVPEAAIAATPFVSVAVPGHEASGITLLEEYYEWATTLANDGKPWEQDTSTLLGEPFAVQANPLESVAYRYQRGSGFPQASDPAVELADPVQWRVLLHLATDERLGFDYGGVGAYTVVVPEAELAAGQYDHATCVWQF